MKISERSQVETLLANEGFNVGTPHANGGSDGSR